MKKHFLIAVAITSAFVLSGCSASTPTSPEAETPSVETPTDTPATDTPTTSAPKAGEELTPKIENDVVDIPQRSVKDLNALDATIKATMAKINQTGLVQKEDSTYNTSVFVYDSTREVGEKGIIWFDLGDGKGGAAPMPEGMIASFSGNGGLFRIDSLLLDAITIRDMLTYNAPAQGSLPSAAAYEDISTQNGYELVSPIAGVPTKITLTDGLITKIEETEDDGSLSTYTFTFDVSEYAEFFDVAYPKD
jgi:hypothetical protein